MIFKPQQWAWHTIQTRITDAVQSGHSHAHSKVNNLQKMMTLTQLILTDLCIYITNCSQICFIIFLVKHYALLFELACSVDFRLSWGDFFCEMCSPNSRWSWCQFFNFGMKIFSISILPLLSFRVFWVFKFDSKNCHRRVLLVDFGKSKPKIVKP